MISGKFFHSKTAIITLFAACFVVLISLGVRQVFGLFFIDFNESLKISNTAFGFAIGIQMLMWGLTGPIFGAIADRYGGHVAIISAFIFYTLGMYFLYTGCITFLLTRTVIVLSNLSDTTIPFKTLLGILFFTFHFRSYCSLYSRNLLSYLRNSCGFVKLT